MAQLWNLLRRNSSHQDDPKSFQEQNTHTSSSSSESVPSTHGNGSEEQISEQNKNKKKQDELTKDQLETFPPNNNVDKESVPINIKFKKDTLSTPAHLTPLSRVSSDASQIFERSVQDQATMSSISRRNSFNQLSPGRSQSLISIPTNYLSLLNNSSNSPQRFQLTEHLNSDVFIPTCLDATAEILTRKQDDLEDVEVIQSTIPTFTDVLDQTYYHQRKGSITSPSLSRRQTLVSILETPISRTKSLSYPSSIQQSQFHEKQPTTINPNSNPFISTSPNSSDIYTDSKEVGDIDYSDHKKLNFCSFADLLSDELENQLIKPDNSSKIDNVVLNKDNS